MEEYLVVSPDVEKHYTEEQYEKAKQLVAYRRQASIMFINRAVTHRYIPAAQIIDRLESEGHIGPYLRDRPRKVFIPKPVEYGAGI